ncbi:uncharacterized protein PADG_05830 [Paracoccidioides brasiliensis Pb18]|uniref:Uncharacterized protein n=1 Tax=Paracoccidioides brasiliensis (strain Pb18) TaxID=502780 RepID=C1GEZ4_PARBD|nr:uncharacterized protein PADG_05830 [Paracoccidioides brasiliensis Pb18]EEH49751.2 hypothetical protein PADG_05830 [Paracoccidioides brasiliensis Pb18]
MLSPSSELSMVISQTVYATAKSLKAAYKWTVSCKPLDSISIRSTVSSAKTRIRRLSSQRLRAQNLSKQEVDEDETVISTSPTALPGCKERDFEYTRSTVSSAKTRIRRLSPQRLHVGDLSKREVSEDETANDISLATLPECKVRDSEDILSTVSRAKAQIRSLSPQCLYAKRLSKRELAADGSSNSNSPTTQPASPITAKKVVEKAPEFIEKGSDAVETVSDDVEAVPEVVEEVSKTVEGVLKAAEEVFEAVADDRDPSAQFSIKSENAPLNFERLNLIPSPPPSPTPSTIDVSSIWSIESSVLGDTQDPEDEKTGGPKTAPTETEKPDFHLQIAEQRHVVEIEELKDKYRSKIKRLVDKKDDYMAQLNEVVEDRNVLMKKKMVLDAKYASAVAARNKVKLRSSDRSPASATEAMRGEVAETGLHLAKARDKIRSSDKEIVFLRGLVTGYEATSSDNSQLHHDLQQSREEYRKLQSRYSKLEQRSLLAHANTLKAIESVEKPTVQMESAANLRRMAEEREAAKIEWKNLLLGRVRQEKAGLAGNFKETLARLPTHTQRVKLTIEIAEFLTTTISRNVCLETEMYNLLPGCC